MCGQYTLMLTGTLSVAILFTLAGQKALGDSFGQFSLFFYLGRLSLFALSELSRDKQKLLCGRNDD